MTTKPTTEYVTDVEHEADCPGKGDRSRLCLVREVIQVMTPEFYTDHDGEYIGAGADWEEEDSDPVKLVCNSCEAKRYVVIDKQLNVVAITPELCHRYSRAWGHYSNYKNEPCEYCGFTGRAS